MDRFKEFYNGLQDEMCTDTATWMFFGFRVHQLLRKGMEPFPSVTPTPSL